MMIFISVSCMLFHWPCLPHSTILSIYHRCPTLRTSAFTIIHLRHYSRFDSYKFRQQWIVSAHKYVGMAAEHVPIFCLSAESIWKMYEEGKNSTDRMNLLLMKKKNWFVISHLPMFIVWMIPKRNTRIRARSRLVQTSLHSFRRVDSIYSNLLFT